MVDWKERKTIQKSSGPLLCKKKKHDLWMVNGGWKIFDA